MSNITHHPSHPDYPQYSPHPPKLSSSTPTYLSQGIEFVSNSTGEATVAYHLLDETIFTIQYL